MTGIDEEPISFLDVWLFFYYSSSMQAVILAGGKGTRMGALSNDTPKPMLTVGGKNLLQHKIDRMPESITEVVIIVHHKKEVIIDFFGDSYNGKTITYIDQGEPKGTGHALWKAQHVLHDEFITMMGDDIYSSESIKAVMSYPWAMTVAHAPSFPGTLDVETDSEGYLAGVKFSDAEVGNNILLDVCLYKFNTSLFSAQLIQLKNKVEWGLPHTFFSFVQATGTKVKVIETDSWIKINDPTDLDRARSMC